MAGVNAVARGQHRVCYNCNQPGHLREGCPKLHSKIRALLKEQAVARGHGRDKGCDRGRGGPAVAAISMSYAQHMVDSPPDASSTFRPDKWLVDSGADINICFNYEWFSYIEPSHTDKGTPISSTPPDVLARGVVKVWVGHNDNDYVDHDEMSHPIDLEIEDVYWVPGCLMNVLATPCLAEQNICLYMGNRGIELYMPGFENQMLGKYGMCTQEMDQDCNPVLVFNLGKGRPVMHTHLVYDG